MYFNVGGQTTSDNERLNQLAKVKNLSRFGFVEETRLMLLDWLSASYSGEAADLIDEAVKAHIEGRLDNEPEMRKRFNAARARRVGGAKPKVVPLKNDVDKS